MNDFFLQSIVMPVCTCTRNANNEVSLANHFGTAFQISPGYFITAAHVVRNAHVSARENHKLYGLVTKGATGETTSSAFCEINNWEEAPAPYDIAIGTSNYMFQPDWVFSCLPISPWQDVYSYGYPESAKFSENEAIWLNLRYYKGYVQRLSAGEFVDGNSSSFEVSFPVPPGMSGSPIAAVYKNRHQLLGVAVGTSATEWPEHSITETLENGMQYQEKKIRIEHHSRINDITLLRNWAPHLLRGVTLETLINRRMFLNITPSPSHG